MAPQKPLESCAVCHGDTSYVAAKSLHKPSGLPAVANVATATSGADFVVTYNLKVDGTNRDDFLILRSDYRFDGVDRIDTGSPLLVSTGAGNYRITVPGGAATAVDSRFLFRVANSTDRNVRINAVIVADVGNAPQAVVSDQSCANCHGAEISIHYGYQTGAAQCIVCHDSSALPDKADFFRVVHGVHNSHQMPGGHFVYNEDDPATPEDESEIFSVTYPTYMTNCRVCHDTSATLAAANSMSTTGPGCLSCHGSMESWEDVFKASGLTFHDAFDATTDCTSCHRAGGVAQEKVLVTDYHNGYVNERGGVVWNGVDTAVTEGAKFDWQITGVAKDGTNLKISWTATYAGAPVDPCNATPAPGAPAFHAIPPLPPVPPSTSPTNRANLSMLRSYAIGDDYVVGTANAPGQASAVNVTTANTTCAANVATTTIAADNVTASKGVIALQGRPWVVAVDPADADGVMQVRAKTPTYEYVVSTGAQATARRDVVETGACLKCHVGSLYQHGGNRIDNVSMCILCHNSASSDQHNRVLMKVDATEAYDGNVGKTFEMKTMLHAIHSAGGEGQKGYVVYRTRGIYAWTPEGVLPPNWPTGAPTCRASTDGAAPNPITGNLVFGADPAVSQSCQTHNLHHPTYPRPVNDCAACHTSNLFAYMPDQAKAVATTLDAGGTDWRDLDDDVLQGATSAACTSCHQSSAASGHANQNGWVPSVFENGRQTIIDAAK